MSGVNGFLDELNERVRLELKTPVEIEECGEFPDVQSLPLEKRRWARIEDAVAVVVDLKGSTRLDFRRRANTSARLYEAVTGNCARIAKRFEPNFVDIQGDGLFALYHGQGAYQRSMCAGITLKSFSARCVVPQIDDSMDERFPKSGLKVGMAAGVLVVKRVGSRGEFNEPVWAGKPVNWASKCANKADANELIATESVYRKFETNDYVRYSCGCQNGHFTATYSNLWSEVKVETIPDDQIRCMKLGSYWCPVHGDEFCEAILAGKTQRPGVLGGIG
jgi:class 3 adenylate cyclase